jgi:DNA polymerase-3 subunit epsilon
MQKLKNHGERMPIRLTRPLVFFDLETTGVDAKTARIIEISVAKHLPDGTVESKTRRFNPGMPIPAEATEVHGITDADVAHEPEFERVASGLASFLADCDLAGYNLIRYDLPVLEAEFRRAEVPFSLQGRQVLDVMRIFYRKEPRDLAGACRFYLGREHDGAHSAEGDVSATAEVLGAMMARYGDLPSSLPELCEHLADPDKLDLAGNLVLNDGKPHLNFGKHAGKSLEWVAQNQPDYLDYILKQDFLSDTKAIVAGYLGR